ncbi:MAG: sel1 repeat family protein, partial [Halomonas sp.]|nr:sel1 repeat family protein [Halomonas sp.]
MKGPTRLPTPRLDNATRILAGATLVAWLGGCATTGNAPLDTSSLPQPAVDPKYSDLLDGGAPPNVDSMDWGRIDFARQAIASGQTEKGIEQLQALVNDNFPPAYYELAQVYDKGIGVPRDPARAASLYAEAVRTPSSILGYASLGLARLYLAGEGV